jgi:hypothetical protein
MAPRKVDLALKVKAMANSLGNLLDSIDAISAIYTASGYGSGGSDPITDGDLQGHAVTAAQLVQFGNMAAQIKKLMANQAPTVGKYREQLDAFRDIP